MKVTLFLCALIVSFSISNAQSFEKGLRKALQLADTETKKAQAYYEAALQYYKLQEKTNSRKHALEAVKVDPSLKKAYTFIGDLYFSSFDECKEPKNIVNHRAVSYSIRYV